ncbi:MAG TPA: transposase [Amycolatopsis sp.]|nr:transposase [Amycolatopsis sp.]HVV08308.1 transposase [Amycolatopsis sp.]
MTSEDTAAGSATNATPGGDDLDVRVARELIDIAREGGVSLAGPNGLLRQLTRTVLETALNAEMDEHLGYEKGDRAGKFGLDERNGSSAKTVRTDVGEVRIEVPRDREGTFTPQIVPKYARRVEGFDDTVISLYAKGLTTGEIQAHTYPTYIIRRYPVS